MLNQTAGQIAATEGELNALCSQIERQVEELFNARDRLQENVRKLLVPRPKDVAVGHAMPPSAPMPNSLQTRLQSIADRLASASGELHSSLSDLDRAC